jgi:hypothetical protein
MRGSNLVQRSLPSNIACATYQSSHSRSRGLDISARPTVAICCWPPERSVAGSRRQFVQPWKKLIDAFQIPRTGTFAVAAEQEIFLYRQARSVQRTLLVLMSDAHDNTSRIGEGAISGTKTLLAWSGWSAGHQPRCATPMHTAVRVFSWYGESFKRSSDDMSDHKSKSDKQSDSVEADRAPTSSKSCSARRRRAGTFNIA